MTKEELKEIEDRCNKVAPFEIGFSKKTGQFVSFFDGIGVVDLDEGEIDFIIHSREDILALLAHIKELESRLPRWIPVEERLPEKGVDVEMITRGRRDIIFGTWFSYENDRFSNHVTHWRPLPECPEEE